jgi:ParB family chromosome partitioning protein
MSAVQERIPIADIVIGEQLAALTAPAAAPPAGSGAAEDLTAPIIVRPRDERTYRLLAGYRPLMAARRRGAATVPVVIKDVDRLEEELIAATLTALERAEHLWRRWERYAAGHPAATRAAFAAAEAPMAGLQARAVEEHLQIAEGLTPAVRALVRPTPVADRPRLLRELAGVGDADQQRQMAEALVGVLGHNRALRPVRGPAH